MDRERRGDTPPASAGWTYWCPHTEGILELGALRGSAPGLAPHFHGEVQITLVLAGHRSLVVEGRTIELGVGRCLCIPAGVPHASLAEPPDVIGLTAFVPSGAYALDRIATDIERSWVPHGETSMADLASLVRRHRLEEVSTQLPFDPPPTLAPDPIRHLAGHSGMSREGFSRAFARRRGMPPHAFRLAARLERARKLLRTTMPLAEIAAETGFADQSHLGRAFRRAFGVSPGRYRMGRAVTIVPD